MSNCSHKKNPLIRQGTSQDQRALPAFAPDAVEVIDKSPVDWMVWGAGLSKYITKYALNDQPGGDMSPFFANDIAARLANIATHKVDSIPQLVRQKLEILYENDNALNEALLKTTFTQLFDLLFSYLFLVDQQAIRCAEAENFIIQLENHIEQRLQFVLDRTLSFYFASELPAHALIDDSNPLNFEIFRQAALPSTLVLQQGLSSRWWSGQASWDLKKASISPQDGIFGSLAVTAADKIRHAASHNFFTKLLDEIGSSAAWVVKESRKALDKKLTDWPFHKPHYALYLAHLELMEAARKDINGLTDRHLNYYYQDILRFRPKPASPDKAHILVELSKTTDQFEIKSNTAFNGGTDENGNIIKYLAERDTVINKASIAEIKSVYLADSGDSTSTPTINNTGRLFASPVARSSDGIGGELTSELKEWHPFFIKQYDNGVLTGIEMPRAEVGFAIASHYLKCSEGKRTVTLRLAVSNPAKLAGVQLSARITTEKEWLELNFTGFSTTTLEDGTTPAARLDFEIVGDQDPIAGYIPKTHGYQYDTTEPVLMLTIQHQDGTQFPYTSLVDLNITAVELRVTVGSTNGSYNEDGLKNLELHNDDGQLNASKPFLPWGPEPETSGSFIIGSNEVFTKPGSTIQLNLKWKEPHGIFNMVYPIAAAPNIRVDILDKGKWSSLDSSKQLFSYYYFSVLEQHDIDLSPVTSQSAYLEPDAQVNGYSAGSQNGYIRLVLLDNFGHEQYRQDTVKYLVRFAKNPDSPGMTEPWEPYQPELESLYLSYSSFTKEDLNTNNAADFEDRSIRFFHIGPFGVQEQHNMLQGESIPTPTLFPVILGNAYPSVTAQGAIYIGLKDLAPGESTSVLFQVNEGSENPLRAKPPEHLEWSWLGANGVWQEFDSSAVEDATNQWLNSGIVKLAIPRSAVQQQTLFTSGLVWVRAVVRSAPDAVSNFIDIHPNAIIVARELPVKKENPVVFSASGTISKLVAPVGQVKKITQPYNSFEGKSTEEFQPFYQRVSERLRHKNRAITIWDYERLVLEAFPDIYRVKCLNHTKLTGSEDDGTLHYNEVAPGHVTVITIPDLKERNDTDPLKPFTKTSVLGNIKDYLRKRSSCHVQIHTAQPLFEEVQVKCKVYLREGYSDLVFYENTLREEITRFLSPWAFDSNAGVRFGGIIYKSAIIDFIDELVYVDYVTDVELYRIPCTDCDDVDEVEGSTARSILVSASPQVHGIQVFNAADAEEETTECDD